MHQRLVHSDRVQAEMTEIIAKLKENDIQHFVVDHNRGSAKQQGSKERKGWTEETSPANAGKCRKLGKAPTDEPLEQYTTPC